MKFKFTKVFFTGLVLFISHFSQAALITHNGSDFTESLTPPFGTVTDVVGEFYINWGVDYSFGNQEGVFNDPPAALCGINLSGECDLITDADGRIVDLGTTSQSFTSFVSVTAGNASAGTLLLEVFDISMSSLGSATNGTSGTSTFSVDRLGIADIAFFRVSGNDTWGLKSVSIEAPVSNAPAPINDVPAPATLGLFVMGMFVLGKRRLAKR